jgi:hypothetical protein
MKQHQTFLEVLFPKARAALPALQFALRILITARLAFGALRRLAALSRACNLLRVEAALFPGKVPDFVGVREVNEI